jgi:hypothetical protein
MLRRSNPETALRLIEKLLLLSDSEDIDRTLVADTWLRSADIYYKRGRHLEALRCLSHGILTRPIVVGRPVKRTLTRLARSFKN